MGDQQIDLKGLNPGPPRPLHGIEQISDDIPQSSQSIQYLVTNSLQNHQHCIEKMFHRRDRMTLKAMMDQHNRSCALNVRYVIIQSQDYLLLTLLTMASEKMYKHYIKKWGLRKNLKESEVKAIVRKRHERTIEGKKTIIAVGARKVSDDEINRFLRRRNLTVDDIITQRIRSRTPPTVRCYTPEPTRIRLPDTFRDKEILYARVNTYMTGFIDSQQWKGIIHKNRGVLGTNESIMEFSSDMHSGNILLLQSKYTAAGETLNRACSCIPSIVSKDGPHTLNLILTSFFAVRKFPDVIKLISKAFFDMSGAVHGNSHPLNQVWAGIADMVVDQAKCFETLLVAPCEFVADRFAETYGQNHPLTLAYRVIYFALSGNVPEIKRIWKDLKTNSDSIPSQTVLAIGLQIATIFRGLQQTTDLIDVLMSLKLLFPLPTEYSEGQELLYRFHSGIRSEAAIKLYCDGKSEEAIGNMREAIRLLDWAGATGRITTRLRLLMEGWLAEQGMKGEEETSQQKTMERIVIEPLRLGEAETKV